MPFENYSGNQLRIDGYYYQIDKNNTNKVQNTLFFYRNGVFLLGYGYEINNVDEWEDNWNNGSYLETRLNYRYPWGVFKIEGNIIKYENWTSGPEPYSTTKEGVILNDTTFQMITIYQLKKNGKKKKEREIDYTYHFKQFHPKPDSTNPYVP